ncbi:hypothetical protein, partial [Bacillus inaquosorum]
DGCPSCIGTEIEGIKAKEEILRLLDQMS